MAASPKKSLALDTNLLLDLAGEKDFAHEFREEFFRRNYSLFVPPTVVAELAFFASLPRSNRGLAWFAVKNSRNSRQNVLPLDRMLRLHPCLSVPNLPRRKLVEAGPWSKSFVPFVKNLVP
jgi:predicted nucleic acid-binding protein